MPPEAVKVTLPVDVPKHEALTTTGAATLNAATGWVTVALVV